MKLCWIYRTFASFAVDAEAPSPELRGGVRRPRPAGDQRPQTRSADQPEASPHFALPGHGHQAFRFYGKEASHEPQCCLPRLLERHLERCPGCRRHLEIERILRERLIAEADREQLPAPPFLDARILANLGATAETGSDGLQRQSSPALWGTLVGGLALIAAAVLLVLNREPALRQPAVAAPPVPPSPTAFELASLGLPSRRDLTGLSVTFEKPLEGEFQLAVSDVHHAAVSLAESLLPESAAQALLRPSEP